MPEPHPSVTLIRDFCRITHGAARTEHAITRDVSIDLADCVAHLDRFSTCLLAQLEQLVRAIDAFLPSNHYERLRLVVRRSPSGTPVDRVGMPTAARIDPVLQHVTDPLFGHPAAYPVESVE